MLDLRWKAYSLSALIFALDRFTKWVIETRVSFFDTHRVIPGFFEIIHSENRGVAFGLFNDSPSEWRTLLLVVVSLVALVALVLLGKMLWNADRLDRFTRWGFAAFLGGAVGNGFDRVVSGRVTDFLLFYIGDYQWPAFNVADTAIVVGAGLLLIDLLRSKRQAANVP